METLTESKVVSNARLSKRLDLRRKQVCDVAAKLFTSNGYQATTLEMIADELGYSKPNLYHYFKNKESIIIQLIENLAMEIHDAAKTIIGDNTEPADEIIRHIIISGVEILCGHPEGRVLWSYEASLHTERTGSRYPESVLTYFMLVKTVFDRGKSRGLFRPVEDSVVLFSILGAISFIPRGYDPQGPLNPTQLGEQLSDVIMGGLLRDPASGSH